MQHLDEGTIHAWLDGALDADEAARVEQHAAECAACSTAIAEARGFVAGASRILGALDHTPGGVVPESRPGSLGARRPTRASRPLWRVLHFTPARAAAAAVLIVAAGTVLVLRHAPNGAIGMQDTEAGPEFGRRSAPSAAAPVPSPTPAASPLASGPAQSQATAKADDGARRGMAVATPKKSAARAAPDRVASANQSPAVMDSMSVVKAIVAAPAPPVASSAPSPMPSVIGGSAPAAQPRVAAGVAGRVAAPAAELMHRSVAAPTMSSLAGCYAVEADSAAGLPARVVLDSARLMASALESRARVADQAIVSTKAPKAFIDSTRRAPSVSWEPLSSVTVRLRVAGSAVSPIDLHANGSNTLTGTKKVGDRELTVVLRKVEGCSGGRE